MRLKSYFADSVEAAMEQARAELGAEAMLISSHETNRDLKDLGAYEVVFGLAKDERADSSMVEARPRGSAVATEDAGVLRELAELRRQLEHLGQSVTRSSVSRATENLTPEASRHFNRLLNAGLSAQFAHELIEAAARRAPLLEAATPPHMHSGYRDVFARNLFEAVLREEIENRFAVNASLAERSTATVFVGAPGCGKTTSLVKLGLQYGLKARRPLQFWSLDTLRVGGADQLGKFSRLCGAGFRTFSNLAALESSLARCGSDDLILIDTPGLSANDGLELQELAQWLRKLPVEVQLVMPASIQIETAQNMARRFAPLGPAKLLMTHVDEIENRASLIECAVRLALPLSFIATGQQIPEDITTADKAALSKLLAAPEAAAKGVGA